jgi:hypothetical protein
MNKYQQAIAYFEDAVRESDEIIADCSPALQAELTAQKNHFVVALEVMRKNRWIPVSERLPECDKRYGETNVLVCMDDEFIATATYVKNKGFELWAESGDVTYWMPLPEPPKEESK